MSTQFPIAEMHLQWDAFVERYVDAHADNIRQRILQRLPHTVANAPQFTAEQQQSMQQHARRNARLLYDIAFSECSVGDVIRTHLPTDVKVQYRRGFVETLQNDLRDVTETMAEESKDLSQALHRYTLDRLLRRWISRRDQAARAIGVPNFRMPHSGNLTKSQRLQNDNIQRVFHKLLAEEESSFLQIAIRGLCHEYVGWHARLMRRMFPHSITREDINTEEDLTFGRALRLYELEMSSEEGRASKSFSSYLIELLREVPTHLSLIRNSTSRKADALRQPRISIDQENEFGDTLAASWNDPNHDEDVLTSVALDESQAHLFQMFGDWLLELSWRERQMLTLRFGLKIPDVPHPGDQSISPDKRRTIQKFKDETEAIRNQIEASRTAKRNEIPEEHRRSRQTAIDRKELPGIEELCLYFPPLNSRGKVTDPTAHISHQAVAQTVKVAIKKLIGMQRKQAGIAEVDDLQEAAIINGIYETCWGRKSSRSGCS